MMNEISIKQIFLALLVLSGIWFCIALFNSYKNQKAKTNVNKKEAIGLAITGFVANFFDTLGIGSFAIMTSSFKNFKLVDDKLIPGTLNVGVAIVCITQAFLFIDAVKVDTLTLMSMIVSALGGALIGASIVSKLNKQHIQLVMTIALFIMGITMILKMAGLLPGGDEASSVNGFTGGKLVIACVANFVFGALNTIGIGLFAPCMVTLSLLGLHPSCIFPIMMGSTALLVPFAGIKYIKENVHNMNGSILINIFGTIGVFVAFFLVKQMDLVMLKYLVIIVVGYTTWEMGKSYIKSKVDTKKENQRLQNQ
ncbi:sulfite exporter TauE/SafE family protein [Flammeovirga sp. SubArs3]|uniref:sulfite exporter TauE/SafE family protein n=1 Tax=Flammeovirga sp. SubArs3 TaxID=2995316 RepID=UPI00248D00DD|nr:sulfite exporter TauE/SafE family protein [Flammeovirga sp. SubArs3]